MALSKTGDLNNFEEIREWSTWGSADVGSGTPPHRVDAAMLSPGAWGREREGGSPSQAGQHRGRLGGPEGVGASAGRWLEPDEASLPQNSPELGCAGCQKPRSALRAEGSPLG